MPFFNILMLVARRSILIFIISMAYAASPAHAQLTAFVGGTIIDGRGGVIENGVLITRGDTILTVGSVSDVKIPTDSNIIDFTGKSLLPGLADMHVHLAGGWDGLNIDMLRYQNYLNSLLYAGVTTVFDTGSVTPFIIQLRDEIAAGNITGPTIYCTGAMIDGADPIWPPLSASITSESQAERLIATHKQSGVDAIKIYQGVSLPLVKTLVDKSADYNLPVIVDQWRRNGSYDLIDTGVNIVAHVPDRLIDPATLELIKSNNVKFMTTLATQEAASRERLKNLAFLDHPVAADTILPAYATALRTFASTKMTKAEKEKAASRTARLDVAKKNIRTLVDAGIILAAGTDAPYPGVLFGEALHRELELLVEAGLTPLEAITIATHNAAALAGDENWGSLSEGKKADLIVVNGRPDKNIGATRNIEIVMKNGKIIDRNALKYENNNYFDAAPPVEVSIISRSQP